MEQTILKGLILGVDLDGVCADFYGRMREIAAEWFERRINDLTPAVSYGLREWGVQSKEQYESLHRFAVTQRDLFKTAPSENTRWFGSMVATLEQSTAEGPGTAVSRWTPSLLSWPTPIRVKQAGSSCTVRCCTLPEVCRTKSHDEPTPNFVLLVSFGYTD